MIYVTKVLAMTIIRVSRNPGTDELIQLLVNQCPANVSEQRNCCAWVSLAIGW